MRKDKKGLIKISNYIFIIVVFGMLATGLVSLIATADGNDTGFLASAEDNNRYVDLNSTFGGGT